MAGRLRGSFASVLAEVPGGVRRPVDVRRALGLDPALAWSVFRAATGTGDMSAVIKLPGPVAMTNFFRAAVSAGVAPDRVDQARRSYEAFLELVDHYADDRASFNSMVGNLYGSDDLTDRRHRRQAFRANSHLWGIRARTWVSTAILRRSADGTAIDAAFIQGYLGVRRIRHGLQLSFGFRGPPTYDPAQHQSLHQHGFEVLKSFSSRPLPKIVERFDAAGFARTEIITPGFGARTETSILTAKRALQMLPLPPDPDECFISYDCQTPVELLVRDFIVFDDLDAEPELDIGYYARKLDTTAGPRFDAADLLPTRGELVPLGGDVRALETADVPRYAAMLRYVTGKLGWTGTLKSYRCREEYPLMRAYGVIRWSHRRGAGATSNGLRQSPASLGTLRDSDKR